MGLVFWGQVGVPEYTCTSAELDTYGVAIVGFLLWFATLAEDTKLKHLVAIAKQRWNIERDYQELKQELGLGHYEERSLARILSSCHALHCRLRLPAARAKPFSPYSRAGQMDPCAPKLPAHFQPRVVTACCNPAVVLHVGANLGAGGLRWERYQSISGGSLLVSGLLLGWMRMNFAAFANLPLWISWILFAIRGFKAARVLAGVALVLSLETLQLMIQPYVWDESGTAQGYLAAPHIGVICWTGSVLVMVFASHRLAHASKSAGTGETN